MKGIYTALITPYKNNGKVDYAELKRLLARQESSEVAGVVLLGSTGEERLLSEKEKMSIISCTTEQFKTKELVVGISANSAEDAIKTMQKYSKYAINCFLIAPPPYLKLSSEEIISFYSTIAYNIDSDICMYNIPSRTGTNIDIDAVAKLCQIKNIVAVKDATGSVNYAKQLQRFRSNSFSVLCGNDDLYFRYKTIGCDGAVCVIGNLLSNLFCAVERSNNRLLWEKYAPLINFVSKKNPAAIKSIMNFTMNINNVLREPLLPMSCDTQFFSKILHI